MGRPKKPGSRVVTLNARVTPEQKRGLEVLATLSGISVSELLRAIVNEYVNRHSSLPDWPNMKAEYRRIKLLELQDQIAKL